MCVCVCVCVCACACIPVCLCLHACACASACVYRVYQSPTHGREQAPTEGEELDAGLESMHLVESDLKNPCLDYVEHIIFSVPDQVSATRILASLTSVCHTHTPLTLLTLSSFSEARAHGLPIHARGLRLRVRTSSDGRVCVIMM